MQSFESFPVHFQGSNVEFLKTKTCFFRPITWVEIAQFTLSLLPRIVEIDFLKLASFWNLLLFPTKLSWNCPISPWLPCSSNNIDASNGFVLGGFWSRFSLDFWAVYDGKNLLLWATIASPNCRISPWRLLQYWRFKRLCFWSVLIKV